MTHFKQTAYHSPQMSPMLIPNGSQQGFPNLLGGILPNVGQDYLNRFHMSTGSSAFSSCNRENFLATELMSQVPFIQQNNLLLENTRGTIVSPSRNYQVSSAQTVDIDDELNNENHPGFVNWIHLRAQRTSSINDDYLITPPSSPEWRTNSQFPNNLGHSLDQISHDSDMELVPVDTNSRTFSANNSGSAYVQQQQSWDDRGHGQLQEEKRGQAENDQEENRSLQSAATSWRQRPLWKNGTILEKCRKLYGFGAPLHFAIKMNDSNRVRQLLKNHYPNSYHRETGETPMHLACRLGKLNIVKLLRRHPKINMNLLTLSGDKAVSPAGLTAIYVAFHFSKITIVKFLSGFMHKDNKSYAELSPLVFELSNEQEIIKGELDRLKALTKENQELEKKLRELEVEDVCIMGKRLPRTKPTDNKKLAGVLKTVRELERDLTALQEKIWLEREDQKQCIICVEKVADTVLVPCGHFFCSICSRAVDQCPTCRHRIERRVKTFR